MSPFMSWALGGCTSKLTPRTALPLATQTTMRSKTLHITAMETPGGLQRDANLRKHGNETKWSKSL